VLDIFFQTVPFFMVIGLGYVSGRTGFFSSEATAYLTRFVFYFALSAMIFRFASTLDFGEVFSWRYVGAYLAASGTVYLIATGVAAWRGVSVMEGAVEAQCATIGNVGFLGIPMLALMMGERAIGYVMMVLSCDLIVFGSLIVILITGGRDGRMSPRILRTVALGLVKNPMIMAIALGLISSSLQVPIPGPIAAFLQMLGAAATPGALFAIGASLATKSAERVQVAAWLSFSKLALHPALVTVSALWLFHVEPFAAGVMIACAAMPVAGNIYILAQHYGVAPLRVSSAILFSTVASVVTLSAVLGWVTS